VFFAHHPLFFMPKTPTIFIFSHSYFQTTFLDLVSCLNQTVLAIMNMNMNMNMNMMNPNMMNPNMMNPNLNPLANLQLTPQLYSLLLAQVQHLLAANQSYNMAAQHPLNYAPMTSSDSDDDKKKGRFGRSPYVRRERQVRPKVVEAKGAIQCKGMNRKKNIQCRNAALMEYIGKRPQYCAEHIENDPNSLYAKCKSSYQRVLGDGKGCKEVVLKEFVMCYKHFGDAVTTMIGEDGYQKACKQLSRVKELLTKLEEEAALAKKQDADLYQRKNKLIPKFQVMKSMLVQRIGELERNGYGKFLKTIEGECTEIQHLVIPPLEMPEVNFSPGTPTSSSSSISSPSSPETPNFSPAVIIPHHEISAPEIPSDITSQLTADIIAQEGIITAS